MDSGLPSDPLHPPIEVIAPTHYAAPVVFASPHSGSIYPASFLAAAQLDPVTLRRSEDAFIDELFTSAPTLGMPLIKARFPRAYVDVNREPWELDPAMFTDHLPDYVNRASPRAHAGLGTIARVVAAGREIYRGKLRFAEAKRRVETLYMPYHDRLEALLREMRARWAGTVLVDCHSMPSVGGTRDRDAGRRRLDFVLGDCHGQSCASSLVDRVEKVLCDLGYTVARNDPYAGGFTTRHYGRPQDGRHALQIEINRALYMDEQRILPRPYFATLSLHIARVVGEIRDHARTVLAQAA
ncbi:MAG: N-formylglutamate amidohydrolase [Alphaproteobacteria bacterium]|nr:N-formylglutamate amidohydrolase [Alphaproteobacteria bacterium]